MIRTYSSDKAPKSDWKNAENSQSAFDAYNYIAAHYASSSSDIARAIIEQVEKENSPLAYDFQFPFFKENFHSLQTQLKTATQN
jgi:hypothetical protein